MWVIPKNQIGNVQMLDPDDGITNIENPNFPAINMIDQHPKKLAKATKGRCLVKATNIKWCGSLFILNVDCSKITNIRIYNKDGTIFEKDVEYLIKAGNYYNYYHAILQYKDRWYVFLDNIYSDCTAEFILEYPDTEPAWIGLVTSGMIYKVGDAEWGLSDAPKDFSVIKETINGSTIVIKRNVLKNKIFKLFSTKEQYEQLYYLYREYRDLFWTFIPVKDISYEDSYIRYGLIVKFPQVAQTNSRFLTYNIEVQEVI